MQLFDETVNVYEPCTYAIGRGIERTLGGGLGASFVADVTHARESPGDSGHRVYLLRQFGRTSVTSWARTDCNVDEWKGGLKTGVTWGLSHVNGLPTAQMSMDCGRLSFSYK